MRHRRLLLVLLAFTLAACAAGANPEVGTAAADGDVAGFWLGAWHGVIAPITFVISLFSDNVNVYEVHNSGNWYDFGFVVVGDGAGSGQRSAARRSSRRSTSVPNNCR